MSDTVGYKYETQWTARRFTNRGRVVKGITIHHWGSLGSDFMGIVGWFCNPNTTAQTSAHYCIQGANADGSTARRVACIVDPDLIAWHAGDWQANVDTIGIECRPEARDVDYDVVAELVARLWVTYGVVPLYPHKHWVTTACPGRYDVTRIAKEARDKYRQLTSPTTPTGEIPMDIAQQILDSVNALRQEAAGRYSSNFGIDAGRDATESGRYSDNFGQNRSILDAIAALATAVETLDGRLDVLEKK